MQNERKETKFFICQDTQQHSIIQGSSNLQIFYTYHTELEDVILNPQNNTQIQC